MTLRDQAAALLRGRRSRAKDRGCVYMLPPSGAAEAERSEDMSDWQSDTEYEDHVLTDVTSERTGYVIKHGAWSLFIDDPGFKPKVGETARYFGRGIGSTVRGVVINGRVAFYLTVAEQEAKHRAYMKQLHGDRRAEFEKNREKMDAQVAALPAVFQRRIERFRANNPEFRWEFEPYELSCCCDAVKIADALRPTLTATWTARDAITAFNAKSWEDQIAFVPGLYDGHSGNSFGMACRLALHYLIDPEKVYREHGALAVLVGCEEYGCPPVTELQPVG